MNVVASFGFLLRAIAINVVCVPISQGSLLKGRLLSNRSGCGLRFEGAAAIVPVSGFPHVRIRGLSEPVDVAAPGPARGCARCAGSVDVAIIADVSGSVG